MAKEFSNVYEALSYVQDKVYVSKSLNNDSGHFKYRNAEQILAAAKPVAKEAGCVITLADEIVMVGDRYYVKATASLRLIHKPENGEDYIFSTSALARESENKTGMDTSQITGSTSSYARKYALGALLAIDGLEADPDSNEYHEKVSKAASAPKEAVNTPYIMKKDTVIKLGIPKGKTLDEAVKAENAASFEKFIDWIEKHPEKKGTFKDAEANNQFTYFADHAHYFKEVLARNAS